MKGDPPVMGITKLGDGVTKEMLMRPRKPLLPEAPVAKLSPASAAHVE